MRTRYNCTILLGAVLVSAPFAVATAEEDVPLHKWGDHDVGELYQGAITIEDQKEGVRKVAMALGAQLGKESVDGIEVGLFVLQASNPEQLKPGATGPTHLFNVTLLDKEAGALIKEALGSVIIEREGMEPQRQPLKPVVSHHQASARLNERGEYQVSVEFVAEGRKGHTGSMPFSYTGKLMFHSHGNDHDDEHDHKDH
jgi:hypothetical protein